MTDLQQSTHPRKPSKWQIRHVLAAALAATTLAIGACSQDNASATADPNNPSGATQTSQTTGTLPPIFAETLIAFTGATLVSGTTAPPIENAVLLVRNGRIVAVGTADQVAIPSHAQRVALDGAYVIPGLINTHAQVGMSRGTTVGQAAHTLDNVTSQLHLYARYGVTTVISQGDPGTYTTFRRSSQDTVTQNVARVYTSGSPVAPETTTDAVDLVALRAQARVDWISIATDEVPGRSAIMLPELYGMVIRAAQDHGLRVAAQIGTLEDAKELVRRGVGFLVHSVHDQPVDQQLIDLMLSAGVCLTPTLIRDIGFYMYSERPAFFDDPFFAALANPESVQWLEDPVRQSVARNSATGAYFRETLPLVQANLLALHRGGVPIVLGTESGTVVGRFQGYFEYLEMVAMQDAGLSPAEVLRAATSQAAACMRLADVGTLEVGKWADFVVLQENPLEDIRALSSIREVRIAGNLVR